MKYQLLLTITIFLFGYQSIPVDTNIIDGPESLGGKVTQVKRQKKCRIMCIEVKIIFKSLKVQINIIYHQVSGCRGTLEFYSYTYESVVVTSEDFKNLGSRRQAKRSSRLLRSNHFVTVSMYGNCCWYVREKTWGSSVEYLKASVSHHEPGWRIRSFELAKTC